MVIHSNLSTETTLIKRKNNKKNKTLTVDVSEHSYLSVRVVKGVLCKYFTGAGSTRK